jgi:nicotinamidase-related amidase
VIEEQSNQMNHTRTILNDLIHVNDCVLALIDIQDSFLRKYSQKEVDLILSRVGWLVEIAKILNVPLVATAESIDRMGSLSPSLVEKLPPHTPIFNKMVFNLSDNPEIFQAVKDCGRKTVVLVGLETDVCIAQSALGLIQSGFQVAVVADATNSPGGAHEVGLERMRNAGVLVTSVKALFYEWVRTVEMTHAISREHIDRIGTPLDIIL